MKSGNLGKREAPGLIAATPALAEELGMALPELRPLRVKLNKG